METSNSPKCAKSKVFKNINYDRNEAQNKAWDSKETNNESEEIIQNKENNNMKNMAEDITDEESEKGV